MKDRLKKFFGIPFILLILIVIIALGIRSGEFASASTILTQIPPGYLIACVLCFAAYLVFDALGIHSAIRRQGYRLPFRDTFMVSLRGQYYYYITPGASGGQPMQIYYLRELGIPTGVGTSVLVLHFASFQIMLAFLTLLFAIPHLAFLRQNIDGHYLLLLFGFIINTGIAVVMLLFSFFRKPVQLLIRLIDFLIRKLRLSRNPDKLKKRLQDTANLFHDSMELMIEHPGGIFLQLFYGGVQQILLMTMIYIVYCGLGQQGASYMQIISLSFAQYISASYVPIPGASGAQEGVFSLFFRQIFPGASCYAAMLLWRTTTFYLPLLVSALSIVFYRAHSGNDTAHGSVS